MAADFVKTFAMVIIGLFIWRTIEVSLLSRDSESSLGRAMAYIV